MKVMMFKGYSLFFEGIRLFTNILCIIRIICSVDSRKIVTFKGYSLFSHKFEYLTLIMKIKDIQNILMTNNERIMTI
jgi:hypothetical protein